MAENPVNRKSSRHIDTRRHFIGELVAAGTVKLADCRTDEMVADALTKSLPYPSFKKHRSTMMGEEGRRRYIRLSCKWVSVSMSRSPTVATSTRDMGESETG